MEKLVVEDFLVITKAVIELRRINVFIGPQAQGKSVIAKLVYFFKELPYEVAQAGTSATGKREFDASLLVKFESIFPRYAWEGKEFFIFYESDYFSVSVCGELSGSKTKLKIKYSSGLSSALTAARRTCRKLGLEDEEFTRPRFQVAADIRDAVISAIYKRRDGRIEDVMYVPAGRSFFANLQRTIFSFVSISAPIDYFLKEFGALYERTRVNEGLVNSVRAGKSRPRSVTRLVEELICGRYVPEKDQDWIVGALGRVNVANSSSGQQEALPLAMVLSTWPYLPGRQLFRSFVIEEPEAHLFPLAQSQVVSLIAAAYNFGNQEASYLITTHSPYILSSLNNLIQAGNVAQKLRSGGKQLKELYSVVPREHLVQFSDVSAYYVEAGQVKEILDKEMCLIDAAAIDDVSGFISERFGKLIEMEFSDDESLYDNKK
ncbi:AAA family ATPase [Pseudomonas aeruginosa]|uniref:AAA family ATPase n=1 Tax=Pseudomonas aeruginosa TaxID=287 RepID=UPI000CCBE9C6|nr:AAA family ATPase [Pseudomonas aeruginosa]MEA8429264.1 AAA family ATPase [Pseudomonas aeruginosa]PNU16566.1 hypothetical protein C2M06_04760 [Pseudomonas aeruginosa]